MFRLKVSGLRVSGWGFRYKGFRARVRHTPCTERRYECNIRGKQTATTGYQLAIQDLGGTSGAQGLGCGELGC